MRPAHTLVEGVVSIGTAALADPDAVRAALVAAVELWVRDGADAVLHISPAAGTSSFSTFELRAWQTYAVEFLGPHAKPSWSFTAHHAVLFLLAPGAAASEVPQPAVAGLCLQGVPAPGIPVPGAGPIATMSEGEL